nr:NADH dehydrogenase (ubiquinone) complex I, assembly factor 6 [Leptinotarsa decemlineata]
MNQIKKMSIMLSRKIHSMNVSRNMSRSSAEYCAEAVRKYDYENFICTLLLQNTSRSCAFAIRSFNIEVSQVAEQVTQETIGQMRLKFWEETVDKCFSKDYKLVPKHPVAQQLFKANMECKLSKRYFNNLISSRRNSLKLTSFKTLEELEKYAEQSVSNVFYLVLEGCGVRNVNADHAASHLGKAQGIVQQIRGIPHARRINFLPVPQDILTKNRVSQEEILRSKSSEQLSECTFELASRAHQHLVKARSLLEKVPKEARSALLPAVSVHMYLDRLQKVNHDVFHPYLQQRSWKLLPRLWITFFRNKY